MKIDPVTKRWMRNASDEKAVEAGCWFVEELGQYAVDWIQEHCYLYQGKCAGQPIELMPWQYDAVMRMFGWFRFDQEVYEDDKRLGVLPEEEWGVVRRFKQACLWVPKKNGKSPLLAALGLYLLVGDGEPGQRVYFGAKDGTQARRVVGDNAMKMVEYMDRKGIPLFDEIKTHVREKTIQHLPSDSALEILASANSANQDALHGINGSVLIDETHVVDSYFMGVIKQAGISRRNPFQIEVSTAGLNPHSYGKKRFDYCEKVIAGEADDIELLAVIYAAPQDVTDEQLDKDPLKYARLANPALGYTLTESGFMTSYNQMRQNTEDWTNFKFERLNLWQNSSHSWLEEAVWDACRSDFEPEQLRGLPCFGGLDYAPSFDATSFQLVIPDGDLVYLLSWIWINEKTRDSEHKLIEWSQWEDEGAVRVVPGPTVTHAAMKADLVEIFEQFPEMQALAYDPARMSNLAIELETLGLPMVTFKQTSSFLTEPIREFERYVMEGKVRHEGNPCMDWMVDNAQKKVYADSGKCAIVKPSHGRSIRRIDGVDAALMAFAMWLQQECIEDKTSIYSKPEDERVVFL
ncbi:MAG: hypothetical protein HUJ26_18940 [Planctomycetaceae bacterium]|nr:hypothetical protein [Planctomycetaceae bacterium]